MPNFEEQKLQAQRVRNSLRELNEHLAASHKMGLRIDAQVTKEEIENSPDKIAVEINIYQKI